MSYKNIYKLFGTKNAYISQTCFLTKHLMMIIIIISISTMWMLNKIMNNLMVMMKLSIKIKNYLQKIIISSLKNQIGFQLLFHHRH